MRNLSENAISLLRITAKLQMLEKGNSVFLHPVGYCAAASCREKKVSFCGGDAIRGLKPVTENTIFRIASVSKIFIGASAVLLVQQGLLDLDKDISEYLGFDLHHPQYPEIRITMRQLLTHSASISDDGDYGIITGTNQALKLPEYFCKERIKNQFHDFVPGCSVHYSNFGAGIAGMVVEAVSMMNYDCFVRKNFLCGMDASFYPQRIIQRNEMANCYSYPQKNLTYDAEKIALQPVEMNFPNPHRNYYIPAGKLMISANNLLNAVNRLKKESMLFKFQNKIGSIEIDTKRTLSFAFAPQGVFSKNEMFGHQGMAYGAVCEAWMNPETDETAVYLTNSSCPLKLSTLALAGQAGIVKTLCKLNRI